VVESQCVDQTALGDRINPAVCGIGHGNSLRVSFKVLSVDCRSLPTRFRYRFPDAIGPHGATRAAESESG
jgi:hypothetical protein